jgi:hypothetical protein
MAFFIRWEDICVDDSSVKMRAPFALCKRNVRFSFGSKLVSNEILAVRKIKNGMYGLTQLNEKRVGPLIVQRSKTDEMSQVTVIQERSQTV